jgi:hypothetical protein
VRTADHAYRPDDRARLHIDQRHHIGRRTRYCEEVRVRARGDVVVTGRDGHPAKSRWRAVSSVCSTARRRTSPMSGSLAVGGTEPELLGEARLLNELVAAERGLGADLSATSANPTLGSAAPSRRFPAVPRSKPRTTVRWLSDQAKERGCMRHTTNCSFAGIYPPATVKMVARGCK